MARLGGGVAVQEEALRLGGALSGSVDLGLSPSWGIIGSSLLVTDAQATHVGIALGLRALLAEGFWRRLYLHAGPEFVIEWNEGKTARVRVRGRAGLGYEELLFWGTGIFIEAFGTYPLGAGGTAGLFMEF